MESKKNTQSTYTGERIFHEIGKNKTNWNGSGKREMKKYEGKKLGAGENNFFLFLLKDSLLFLSQKHFVNTFYLKYFTKIINL